MLLTLLFFHLLAVTGLFAGIVLELAALMRVWQAATLADIRAACLNVPLVGPIMGLSVLLLVAMGIAMIYVGGFDWSAAWIDVVFLVTIVLAVIGPAVTGKRSDALHAMVKKAGDGVIPAEIDAARRDPALRFLPWLSLFELIAALFIMTTKPQLGVAILAAVLAALFALIPAAAIKPRRAEPAAATS